MIVYMLSAADRKKVRLDSGQSPERKQTGGAIGNVTFPNIEIEDLYAYLDAGGGAEIAAGAKLIGDKVGLTSKAMQRSSMIDEPDYGYILDDQMIGDGAKARHDNYCRPRVEVELAFIMGKRLQGPGIGLAKRTARHRICHSGN